MKKNPKMMISLAPLLRNIIEYTKDEKDYDHDFLTKILHLKDGSEKIKVSELEEVYKNTLMKLNLTIL